MHPSSGRPTRSMLTQREDVILQLREAGTSFQEIGDTIGCSRQGAHQLYHDAVKRRELLATAKKLKDRIAAQSTWPERMYFIHHIRVLVVCSAVRDYLRSRDVLKKELAACGT